MIKILPAKAIRGLVILLFPLIGAMFATAHAAEKYPYKQIKVIVPYSAGGTADALARVLARSVEQELKQTIIVENRAGAGGNIGTGHVAKASPDGYTLLMVGNSFGANLSLFKNPPYALADFSPIMLLMTNPYIMVANPSLPVKNLQEFIAYAKAHPIHFGSAGIGGGQQLTGELMNSMAGLDMVHVPYHGATGMLTNLVGGDIQVGYSSMVAALPLIESGRLRALAVTSTNRAKALPDVPTVSEAGLAGFNMHGWYGLLAPAGTPPEIVERLNKAFTVALHDPEARKTLEADGNELIGDSPSEFTTFLKADIETTARLIKSSGVAIQ